ncbi:SctK family type III secretion system sorting platform protein, partial [Vibrio parahaemolyticus]|nr:SctK family type III secretion system sorting platform protein [Vibrio parahaemolyticus]
MSLLLHGVVGTRSVVKPETPLAQVQHQFNYAPCQYIHRSWIEQK